MRKLVQLIGTTTLLLFVINMQDAFAQFNVKHTPKNFIERTSNVEFIFELALLDPASISEAYMEYSTDGNSNVVRVPVQFTTGQTGRAFIDFSDVIGSEVNYKFIVEQTDGSKITYPDNGNPVISALVEPSQDAKESDRSGEVDGVEFTVLSPEPGKKVFKQDVVVAIAIFYEEGAAELSDFKLFVNGSDVSSEADISPYFISYVPKIVEEGDYSVSLSLGDTKLIDFSFTSSATPPIQSQAFETTGKKTLNVLGNGELSARNQIIAGSGTDIYRGNLNLSASYGGMRFAANALGTSQEDPRLQPQNRAGAELYFGKWFEVQAGHIYPIMNPLVLNGRRVFGVNAGLHLFNRNLNFQVTYGEMARDVPSLYNRVQYDPSVIVLDNSDGTVDSLITPRYLLTYQNGGAGTFAREVIAGRFGIGNGKYFSFGLNAIKIEDKVESITTVRNFEGLPRELYPSDPLQAAELEADETLLEIQAPAPKPQGNFIVATDLAINADKGRVRLRADLAANLLNEDIYEGPLNSERAENLGFDLDQDLLDLFDQLSIILVVNENMRNLPIRFEEDANGETTVTPFVPYGIFGGQGNLTLNYLNNNINFRYQWLGPDFQPLSNNAIRRDIAGFSIRDRVSLFKNRLYLNAGYEDMEDNILGTGSQTTNTVTYNAGVSIYPISMKLPRITTSYRLQTRNNGVVQENPFLAGDLRFQAIRNLRGGVTDTTLLANPRDISTNQYNVALTQQIQILGMIQDVTLNYTIIDTKDAQFAFGDYQSNILSLGFTNRFTTIPLTVNGSYNLNTTSGLSGLSDINITGFTAGAEMYLLDEKLLVAGNLAVATNSNQTRSLLVNDNETPDNVLDDYYFGGDDISEIESTSYIITARAMYRFSKNHAVAASMNLTNVKNRLSSVAIPNDRILQARYILSF